MLLSRVAQSVYWAGRYLERAEATTRLVHVHTKLFLGLPKAAGVGWMPLLAVSGSELLSGLLEGPRATTTPTPSSRSAAASSGRT